MYKSIDIEFFVFRMFCLLIRSEIHLVLIVHTQKGHTDTITYFGKY